MFYREEDIQPAVDSAIRCFGKPAQYIESNFIYIGLQTPKFGIIWYGDFEGDWMKASQLADTLSSKINQKVSVIDIATSLVMN